MTRKRRNTTSARVRFRAIELEVKGPIHAYPVNTQGNQMSKTDAEALNEIAALYRRRLPEGVLTDDHMEELFDTFAAIVHETGRDVGGSPPRRAALHYPPGMQAESQRLHREYNALVAAQMQGAKNGREIVKLTDECNAKGIILVPNGESL